jgi:hypothetical protein
MAMATDLQRSALPHVAMPSCGKYAGQFYMFFAWCETLAEPRVSLPASDATVALYLQSVMNGVKTFAPVKATPTAIDFYQKISLFNHESTQSQVACQGRSAATQRFGWNAKKSKEPFDWDQVVEFALAYGV